MNDVDDFVGLGFFANGVDWDINFLLVVPLVDLFGIVLGVTVFTIFLACSLRSPCNRISTIAMDERRCSSFSAWSDAPTYKMYLGTKII